MIGLGQAVSFFGTLFHWNMLGDPYSASKYLLIATLVLAWSLTVKPKRGLLTIVGLVYMSVLTLASLIAFKQICFIGAKLNFHAGVFPSFLVFACYHYSICDKWENTADAFLSACCITSILAIAQKFGWFLPQGDYFVGRSYAMIGSPVFLSGVLAMAIPLCLGRGRIYIVVPLLLTAIFLTQSRSGILAAAIGVLGYYYAKDILGTKGLIILSVFALVGVIGMFSGIRNTSASDRGRYQMMRVAGKVIADYPLTGIGPERFAWAILKYRDKEFDTQATPAFSNAYVHNHIVEAQVAGGPIFLLVHLLLIGTVALFIYRCNAPGVFGAALALCAFGLIQPTPLIAKVALASVLGGLEVSEKPLPKAPFIALALCAFLAALSAVTMAKIFKTAADLGLGQMAVEAYTYLPSAVSNQ